MIFCLTVNIFGINDNKIIIYFHLLKLLRDVLKYQLSAFPKCLFINYSCFYLIYSSNLSSRLKFSSKVNWNLYFGFLVFVPNYLSFIGLRLWILLLLLIIILSYFLFFILNSTLILFLIICLIQIFFSGDPNYFNFVHYFQRKELVWREGLWLILLNFFFSFYLNFWKFWKN